jgi:hypothetical protein
MWRNSAAAESRSFQGKLYPARTGNKKRQLGLFQQAIAVVVKLVDTLS